MSYLRADTSGRYDDDAVVNPPPYLLNRYGATVLDPAVAMRLRGEPPPRATVYVRSRLLVRENATEKTVAALQEAAARYAAGITFADGRADALQRLAGELGLGESARSVTTRRAELGPGGGQTYEPVDAWRVLQTFRELVGPDSAEQGDVGLDHVLTATSAWSGSYGGAPFASGSAHVPLGSATIGSPGTEYGAAGVGTRTPVSYFGPPPGRAERDPRVTRRPVVALVDSAVGVHPWLPPDIVEELSLDTLSGPPHPVDPTSSGLLRDPLEGRLSETEHGTFAAGLVRQVCPDAKLLSVPVMLGGATTESSLTDALDLLLFRQLAAIGTGDPSLAVDVVVIACGYYHESAEPAGVDSALTATLRAFTANGVAVIVAAGNDATQRPMYPAALAADLEPRPDTAPVISVGALNPDGTSVALFSNSGDWVTAHRAGAACVSIVPITVEAALQPSVNASSVSSGPAVRASIDPDNFTSGFATWSGTSFAAAVLAGEFALKLLDGADLRSLDPVDAVMRARVVHNWLTG